MKKFVIQEHSRGGQTHWDLMLETGGILKTWRLDTAPAQLTDKPVTAVKIFDHDLKFLTYEGPVNKGAGSVRIVDSGTYETLEETEARMQINLQGNLLSGKFILEHIESDQWLLSILSFQS